jgi:hypothetical protein
VFTRRFTLLLGTIRTAATSNSSPVAPSSNLEDKLPSDSGFRRASTTYGPTMPTPSHSPSPTHPTPPNSSELSQKCKRTNMIEPTPILLTPRGICNQTVLSIGDNGTSGLFYTSDNNILEPVDPLFFTATIGISETEVYQVL